MLSIFAKGRAASTARRWSLAAAVAMVAWTSSGGAQPIPGVDLHWVVPATCPGAEDLQARVRRLLGAGTSTPAQEERLVVDGTVVRQNGRYRLSLDVRRGGQIVGVPRVFDADSCESLAGAAAVTLTLLLRGKPRSEDLASSPTSSASASSQSPESAPPTSGTSTASLPQKGSSPAQPSATPTANPTTAPVPPRPPFPATAGVAKEARAPGANASSGSRWSVVLGGPLLTVDEGVLPSWAFGLGIGGGVRVNRLEALLTAVLWLPQSDTGASPGRYAADYARRSGELSSCYAWPLGRFELGPCLSLGIEDVSANGTGPNVVGTPGHIDWMTVGLAARARWSPWPWTALFVRPRLSFNTSRPSFTIDAVGTLYQTPIAAAGFDLGTEWIL